MTNEEIREAFLEIAAGNLGINQEELTRDKSLKEDLGADSLDAVQLISDLEEVFGIEIPDDEAEKLLTVGDIFTYLEKRADEINRVISQM